MEIARLRDRDGTKLVSPAVAHDKQWMKVSARAPPHRNDADQQRFLSLLPDDAKPDYLAIHIYTTTFESFKEKVESYWQTFSVPIWVTEFAMTVSQIPDRPDPCH